MSQPFTDSRPDFSEWLAGPSLIALKGSDEPGSEYRLGNREYDWHQHARGQLFCVETGLIQVRTAHGAWLLPPHRAGWIPANVSHRVQVSGALSGWSLLLMPEVCEGLPLQPCVIGVTEVLTALARRALAWDKHQALGPEQSRMVAVILDELRQPPEASLHLPMPTDPRLERVVRKVLENPAATPTLEMCAAWGAMSTRTLRRLMLAETGLSFSQWRQQAQLAHGLPLLAQGQTVSQVADALGYASPSNFIAMFRRAFGESPGRFFAARLALGSRRPVPSA
ncbi:AraC family transcriptional regulator [Pseudomonas sp. NPDC089530]|uniref:AraC family transcriptional regulator n=1 Tax=Pseudomonas sp. NPDC089530 TaxID=3390651 RepID=UPI003D05748C